MSRPGYAPRLDALKDALADIGGTYELGVSGLTGPSQVKIAALKATGRDVFALTEQVAQTVRNHWKSGLEFAAKRGDLRTFRPTEATNKALRAVFGLRLPGGNDVHFAPLKPPTVAAKRAHRPPLDPGIGVATRALRNNVVRAFYTLRKR